MNTRFKLRTRIAAFVLPLFFFVQTQLTAQCPIIVDAGPDQVVCIPSGTVTLNGSVSGNYLGFTWSPVVGLSDPSSLTPTATVTGSTTYTLTAQASDPNAPNLVNNGDFEALNTGFTSNFTYTSSPVTPGTYFITTSPSVVNSNFPPCDDHTFGNGTGNMMLINGTGTAGAQVWCQIIPVMPNTFYVMSAWATASPISPPVLQFSVNGTAVGTPYSVGTGICDWQQFSASWNSGSSASATLCIVDQNGSGNGLFGDDFALDDIYFAAACSDADDVNVSIANVNAVLSPTAMLPCSAAQTGMVLNGSGSSSGPGISYQWSGSGILSGGSTASATVNEPGNYTLSVTFDDGTTVCTATANIEVLPDPNIVFANILPPGNLDCYSPTLTLDGSTSSAGAGIGYDWVYLSGPGGTPPGIVTGGNTATPIIDQPGTYTLTVTNAASGCTASASVTVTADFATPTAMANAPGLLSCSTPALTLNGNGSSTGANFTYQWTAIIGHIASGATTLNNCVVDTVGAYSLTVTNIQNGCTASAFVSVGGNNILPTAVASSTGNLSCTDTILTLSGTGSSTGANYGYLWTTTNGNIATGQTTLSPTVNAAGDYVLTVTQIQTGCSASDTVSVSGNATLPVAEAGPPLVLDCNATSQNLNGNGSSFGAGITWLWTGPGILNGETTLTPEVNAAGTYFLSVTNASNGCTALDSVSVTQDSNAPIVLVTVSGHLDCQMSSVTLNGSGSSSGAAISIDWTTAGGHFSSGQNTLMPVVDAPGIYTLTLFNQNNNCSASTSVTVLQDTLAPLVNAGPGAAITCISPTATLNGNGSSQGTNFSYAWSGGNILNGQNTLSPEADLAGSYTLTVTNTQNHCTASASTTVMEDLAPPVAEAGEAAVLTCDEPMAMLDGNASSQGTDFTYLWNFVPPAGGGTGGIVSGETTLMPQVDENGLYFLTVTDTTNGCTATDSTTVSVFADFPFVQIQPAEVLTCTTPAIQLEAWASSGAAFNYQWTTPDGNILSGDTTTIPVIDAPGTYLLTVTNAFNGCTSIDIIMVEDDADPPVADAGTSFSLSCTMLTAQLNGTLSSSGPGIFHLWSTANGSFQSGVGTLTPIINAPGTYTLTVVNTQNGCSATDQVIVGQDANAPIANAGSSQTLTCTVMSVTLNGSNSATGPGITYQWTTQNGFIVSGANTLMPVVNAPGVYLLTVTNTNNNCKSAASVLVQDFTEPPEVNVSNAQLDCQADTINLQGSAAGGGSLSYLWTTTDGNIISGQMTQTPLIDAPGTYTLLVTNNQNGCTATADATVTENLDLPAATIAPPPGLTCMLDEITLDGNGSSTGADFAYLWTTADGNVVSGETTLMPLIDAPGTYTLTVLNQANSCQATASITVTADTTLPVAMALSTQQIGCTQSVVTPDGNGSSTGFDFTYLWTTVDGNILSGETTLMPQVNAGGLYTLTVTDTQNGCTATASVTVIENSDPPVAVIAQPGQLNCVDSVLLLDAGASSTGNEFNYQWTTANGNFTSSDTVLSPTIDAPGTYNLLITNQLNGCTATASASVSQNKTPPGADAGPDMVITCKELEIALTGSSPTLNVTYLWTTQDGHFLFGETTTMPGLNAVGTYTLIVTNPVNGCLSTDEAVVTTELLEDFSFEKTDPYCVGTFGSIVFTGVQGGTEPYKYSIDEGDSYSSEPLFADLQPGVYELTVLDAGGCKLTETVELSTAYEIALSLDPEVTISLGDSYLLDPQTNIFPYDLAEIIWTPATGLDCDDCLTPMAMPADDVLYTLEVTDVNGCRASASILVKVIRVFDIYVPNVFSPNGDGINDVFLIFSKPGLVKQVHSFKIFTRWGESVFVASNFLPDDPAHGWDGTARGKKFGAGVYAWFAEIELLDGERLLLKGDVTLVR